MNREASMISSPLTARDSLLFVYGTLRPFVGIPMAKWLLRAAHYVGPATVRGRLYDLGRYPGLHAPHSRRDSVVGDVYRVVSPRVFRTLDRYEAQFVRRRCFVRLARGGGRRVAWVYRYRYNVASASRIASGDYRAHLREKS
jgi:gamma-glutamylcyclotransferase (GGCT)/AIG2-like uncharacterized protein YtfP